MKDFRLSFWVIVNSIVGCYEALLSSQLSKHVQFHIWIHAIVIINENMHDVILSFNIYWSSFHLIFISLN